MRFLTRAAAAWTAAAAAGGAAAAAAYTSRRQWRRTNVVLAQSSPPATLAPPGAHSGSSPEAADAAAHVSAATHAGAVVNLLSPGAEGDGREPEFTAAEVRQHITSDSVWVTFEGGVYDVTDFVQDHPGGAERLMQAAGGRLEPFWALFKQHQSPAVRARLAPFRRGKLRAEEGEVGAAGAVSATELANDPFVSDPKNRHPSLRVLSEKPFNAECTAPPRFADVDAAVAAGIDAAAGFVTPTDLWFTRSQHPVPVVDPAEYRLEIDVGTGAAVPLVVSLEDLRARFPPHRVTSTIICAGNRRANMNEVPAAGDGSRGGGGTTDGVPWGSGAVSTATWTGARLADVLAAAGLEPGLALLEPLHVWFESLDRPFDASVPLRKGVDPLGDVLLAYEMNGEPIPRDHGFPVRVIVPGYTGARNVKWVARVRVSPEESPSRWQRGALYKGLPPGLRSLKDLQGEPHDIASLGEPPVQSVITRPRVGEVVAPQGEPPSVEVEGWAYSGGGRGIVRVDVTGDSGATWSTAELRSLEEQRTRNNAAPRSWAWTLWRARVPVPKGAAGRVELACKAVDESYNVQPERAESIWNLRGILNNSWHRVQVHLAEAPSASTKQ